MAREDEIDDPITVTEIRLKNVPGGEAPLERQIRRVALHVAETNRNLNQQTSIGQRQIPVHRLNPSFNGA